MSWGEVELESEVADWFLALDEDDQARVGFHVDRLGELGPLLDEPHTNSWSERGTGCFPLCSLSISHLCVFVKRSVHLFLIVIAFTMFAVRSGYSALSNPARAEGSRPGRL